MKFIFLKAHHQSYVNLALNNKIAIVLNKTIEKQHHQQQSKKKKGIVFPLSWSSQTKREGTQSPLAFISTLRRKIISLELVIWIRIFISV